MQQNGPSTSIVAAGLKGRCPRCGKGALFRGGLSLREKCESCGLELRLRRLRRWASRVRHLHPGLS